MTPSELAEIDRQVAEALGWKREGVTQPTWWLPDERETRTVSTERHHHPTGMHKSEEKNLFFPVWRPSTDWNDAHFAAEKLQLFTEGPTVNGEWLFPAVLFTDESYWLVLKPDDDISEGLIYHSGCGWYGKDLTGPLAICQAILHLKGKA